jgi:predicted N-acetyltransferase YhbS
VSESRIVLVRPEAPSDIDAIRAVEAAAFAHHPFSHQTEHLIVDALRDAGALAISLVAEDAGEIVGHIAFSAAQIGDAAGGWYLLGPVAVAPARQREGIGSALVEAGLQRLRLAGAAGCALVGDAGFYRRFGFAQADGVTCEGVPAECVLVLPFGGAVPAGELTYHEAFFVQP